MMKRKTMNNYPMNLLEEIGGGAWEYDFPADLKESLEYVLAGLTDRENRIIHARFRDGKLFGEIAAEENLSGERVRKIMLCAIKKLSGNSRKNYLIYGLRDIMGTETQTVVIVEPADNSCETEEIYGCAKRFIPIEAFDFEAATYNSLKSAGISTLDDILALTVDDLVHIRNIGVKRCSEVVRKVYGYEYRIKVE